MASTPISWVTASFSPSNIFGLVFWHDMQDTAAYTLDTGLIDSITNKVSSVVITQGTAGHRPTYSATGFNGFPCGSYDGSVDKFIGTEAAVSAVFATDGPYTLFIVVKHTTADRTDYPFSVSRASSPSGNHRAWGTSVTGSGRWILAGNTSAAVAVNVEASAASPSNTNTNIFEAFGPGAQANLSINGAALDPSAAAQVVGSITVDQFCVGARHRGPSTTDGEHLGLIGEILLYNSNLSTGDKLSVREYLAAKWGITL